MATFRLHLDTAGTATDPAEVDDDQESIFPHTPRLDDRCFETTVSEALVVECVRPGSCAVPAEAPERDFLHRRCVQIGHASNERKETLMAHSWFQCAYACKASMTELLSATNMRLNLGQWYLCRQLYAHIIGLELTPEQREITTRKQGEVSKYIDAAAGVADPSTRLTAAEELKELLDAPRSNAGQTDRDEARKLLGLLRVCGHAANKAGDFEAAQVRPFLLPLGVPTPKHSNACHNCTCPHTTPLHPQLSTTPWHPRPHGTHPCTQPTCTARTGVH